MTSTAVERRPDYDDALTPLRPGASGWRCTSSSAPKSKMFCGCPTEFGRRAQHPGVPGLPGPARVRCRWSTAAAIESTIRIGLALNCSIADLVPVRPQELLLPGHAQGLPDQPVRRAAVLRRLAGRHRADRRRRHRGGPGRDRAGPHGGGHRQAHPRRWCDRPHPRRRLLPGRLQPRRDPAGRDRHQAGHRDRGAGTGGGQGLRDRSCATSCARWGSPTSGWRRARCAATPTCRWLRPGQPTGAPAPRPRTSTRCARSNGPCRFEIRRQAAVLDAGGTIMQETRHFHEDDGSTTSGRSKEEAEDYRYFPEPDLVPMAPDRAWVEELRATLPELPSVRRARLQAEWGISDFEMDSVVNAGALDLVEATVAAGADQAGGPQVVAGGAGPAGQRARRRPGDSAGHPRRRGPGGGADRLRYPERQAGPTGVRRRARRGGQPRRGGRRAADWRWSPTTAPCWRPSTRPSRPTPMWRPRSGTARSRPPGRSSVRS